MLALEPELRLAPPKMYKRPLAAAKPNLQRGEGGFPLVLLLSSHHSSITGSNTCKSLRYEPESAVTATQSQTDQPQAIKKTQPPLVPHASADGRQSRYSNTTSLQKHEPATDTEATEPVRQPPKTKSLPAAGANPWPILGVGARPRASAPRLVHWRALGS
jgi:hypothetical protein